MKSEIKRPLPVICLLLSLAFISCSKTEDEVRTDPVPIDLTQAQTAIIESGNKFAFDIFRKVLESSGDNENIMISPLSISYALSMTLNGASGETRNAMLEALRINGTATDVLNNSYKDLTSALLSVDKQVLMSIANSVWTENDFTVKQAFIKILTDYYDAESKSFDISDATAPDKINKWIGDKTNNLIKEMIDDLPDNTVMLLINAIYFKGKWKSQFDESKTTEMSFYKSGGDQVNVPMMKQVNEFSIYKGNGFVLAEFPYGQGNFVMDVILPDQQSCSCSIPALLSESGFSGWISQMSKTKINVSFPRFKYGFRKTLSEVLSDMGMGIAFTEGADFSNISDQLDLLLNDVAHQTFIETNEEGTEAAAVTVVEVGITSVQPDPMVFRMDHPFLFIIRESTTNSIIFMGRVADPSVN